VVLTKDDIDTDVRLASNLSVLVMPVVTAGQRPELPLSSRFMRALNRATKSKDWSREMLGLATMTAMRAARSFRVDRRLQLARQQKDQRIAKGGFRPCGGFGAYSAHREHGFQAIVNAVGGSAPEAADIGSRVHDEIDNGRIPAMTCSDSPLISQFLVSTPRLDRS